MGNRAGVAFPTRRGSDISCGYCTVSEELACTLPVSRLMLHAPFFFQTQGCRIVIACSRRFRALAAAHPSLLHETRVILCTRLQAMLEMSENIGRSERKPKPICIAYCLCLAMKSLHSHLSFYGIHVYPRQRALYPVQSPSESARYHWAQPVETLQRYGLCSAACIRQRRPRLHMPMLHRQRDRRPFMHNKDD